MNLTDLRAELSSRAADADDHAGNVLDGVHRRIRRTKQRRVATALASTAALAAVAIGIVVPSLTSSAPEPSDPPPPDYTKDGVTYQGIEGGDRLDKAWIGRPGENPLEFSWTPTSKNVALRPVCRTTASTVKLIRAAINGVVVLEVPCDQTREQPDAVTTLTPDDIVWLDAPLGKPAKVTVSVIDEATRRPGDPNSQLALGIYTSSLETDPGAPPSREAPSSPDDYTKAGIRYRAKVGGDTLAAAVVGEPGQSTLRLRFTATGAPFSLRELCTANKGDVADPKYALRILVNGVERSTGCWGESTDPGGGGAGTITDGPPAGQPVDVTAETIDNSGRRVTVPGARIGVGVYFQGPQRTVTDQRGGSLSLPELTESSGYTYKLDQLKTVDAATTRELSLATPAGRPYLIAAGSTPLGGGKTPVTATLDADSEVGALSADEASSDGSFGLGTYPQPAGSALTATLRLIEGRPTKGSLVLAIYVPVE